MGMPKSRKQCPLCPWIGVNRYYHMKIKHGKTMSEVPVDAVSEAKK